MCTFPNWSFSLIILLHLTADNIEGGFRTWHEEEYLFQKEEEFGR
jgi:hypothetical protein